MAIDMGPEEGDDEDIMEHFSGVPSDHDYAPYGNKTVRLRQVILLVVH